MKHLHGIERVLYMGAGILLLSILLMIIVIPGVYTRSLPDGNNPNAVIGISLAILIHFILFIGYIFMIRHYRRDGKRNRAGHIIIGMFILLFGLIYMDGAIAFSDNDNIIHVSYLMFMSILCDLIASILIFAALLIKPQEQT